MFAGRCATASSRPRRPRRPPVVAGAHVGRNFAVGRFDVSDADRHSAHANVARSHRFRAHPRACRPTLPRCAPRFRRNIGPGLHCWSPTSSSASVGAPTKTSGYKPKPSSRAHLVAWTSGGRMDPCRQRDATRGLPGHRIRRTASVDRRHVRREATNRTDTLHSVMSASRD
jgi:hypothetical protein